MIISIQAEKAPDKIHHPLMIKTLNKVSIQRIYLNIINTLYERPIAIILNKEKLQGFTLRSEMPTLLTFIQHSIGSLEQLVKKKK